MGALVLACGVAASRPNWTAVPARPARADLDPLLGTGPERVVVVGTDADLAAVVLRLLRTERLELPVGFVPVHRAGSAVARLWRLPAGRDAAMALATGGRPRALPLVRDDSGGVLLGRGVTGPVRGEAYCDDQLALRGRARRIEVRPGPAGVHGLVVLGGLARRPASFDGRAFQLGCEPARVTVDGVEHPRPVRRWTWYRHTEDLCAVALPD
ncbi:MAG: hypothetical protein ACJ72N_16315 [Labedaea sp.]